MLTLLMGIFITVYLCQLGGKLPDVSFAFITQTSLVLSGSVLLSSVSLWGKAPFFCVVIFVGSALESTESNTLEASLHMGQSSVLCCSGPCSCGKKGSSRTESILPGAPEQPRTPAASESLGLAHWASCGLPHAAGPSWLWANVARHGEDVWSGSWFQD